MSARKVVKSNIRNYKKRVDFLKEQLMVLQSEIEIQEEELMLLKEQYFRMEK
jgi:hypothetical protein